MESSAALLIDRSIKSRCSDYDVAIQRVVGWITTGAGLFFLAICFSVGCQSGPRRPDRQTPGDTNKTNAIVFCGLVLPVKTTRSVVCHDSAVTNIGPVADLVNLQHLDLGAGGENVCVSDLTPLEDLTSLERLSLAGLPLQDIRVIGSLDNLSSLDISNTKVRSVTPLKSLPHLTSLNAAGTRITGLDKIGNFRELLRLDISGTKVSSLRSIGGISHLKTLILAGTLVDSLAGLTKLENLTELHIPWMALDLGPLVEISSLRKLYVSENRVSADSLRTLKTKNPRLTINPPGIVYLEEMCGSGAFCSVIKRDESHCSGHVN